MRRRRPARPSPQGTRRPARRSSRRRAAGGRHTLDAGRRQRITSSPEAGFEQVGHLRPGRQLRPVGVAATCTSSAPPASSWPGSRWPRRSTPSTTRTRCSRTSSRSTTCSASPMVADPLHRLDCCVVTDGGGALVVVHPDVARELGRAGAVGARPRRGAQARRRRPHRPHLLGGSLERPGRLRGGRRHARRHPVRVDLRLLHDHRAHRARGPRASARRARAARSWPTARCAAPAVACPSTPTAAGCATTTPPTAAA